MEIKNKKRLIVGLTVGIPAVAGLATALGVCVRCSTEEFITIPSDKLNISGDTLKGLKENADVSKYTTLEIPSEVRNIEKSAFKDVFKAGSTVTTVKFSKNIRKLGDSVFENCAGITTFDLTDIDEEEAKYIDWGNNIFGTDETTKPVYINIKFNETLSDTAKETLKNKLLAAGVPAASFAQKVTDKVEAVAETKTIETGGVSKVQMKLDITEEQELSYNFVATADRNGGTPGVGVKLGSVKLEKITSNDAKYKASVEAEIVNAKNNGDYVTYKIDMIASVKATGEVKWVQTLENFKLVYNKESPSIIKVQSVSIKSQTDIEVDDSEKLAVTVLPENAENKAVTWESSKPEIATVDQEGNVIALAIGTTTITVTSVDNPSAKATCVVTVSQPTSKIFDGADFNEQTMTCSIVLKDNVAIEEGKVVIPATLKHLGKIYAVDTIKADFLNGHDQEVLSLQIPSSIKTIESGALSTATKLSEILIDSTEIANVKDNLSGLFTVSSGTAKNIFINENITLQNDSYLLTSGSFMLSPSSTHEGYKQYISLEVAPREVFTISSLGEECSLKLNNNISSKIPGGVLVIPSYIDDGKGNQLKVTSLQYNFHNNNTFTTAIVPDTVTSIGAQAFASKTITNVILHEGIEELGSSAFAGSSINSITLPNSLKGPTAWNNHSHWFNGCEELVYVKMPQNDDFKIISQNTFDGCIKLETCILPPKLEQITQTAFGNCSSLKGIDLPETLWEIGGFVFKKSGLESIRIPSKITSYFNNIFDENEKLKEVIVDSTRSNFFEGSSDCSGLYDVTYQKKTLFITNAKGSKPTNSYITQNYTEVEPSTKEGYYEYKAN